MTIIVKFARSKMTLEGTNLHSDKCPRDSPLEPLISASYDQLIRAGPDSDYPDDLRTDYRITRKKSGGYAFHPVRLEERDPGRPEYYIADQAIGWHSDTNYEMRAILKAPPRGRGRHD